MNDKAPSGKSLIGRMARLPLAVIPRQTVLPILGGKLRGKFWIVGSAIHRRRMGFYEYEKRKIISAEVRPNTVFWDVGANVGFYTLLASKPVGSGRVFAFEPAPRNLDYLRRHLKLNRLPNVEVLATAVSNGNGVSFFQIEETGFMGHPAAEGKIAVQTATLDTLVESGKVLPPDYVKMDTEGTELLALQGASQTFQRYHPVLFLATHGREMHTSSVRLLESWGYECRPLGSDDSGELRELIGRFRPPDDSAMTQYCICPAPNV